MPLRPSPKHLVWRSVRSAQPQVRESPAFRGCCKGQSWIAAEDSRIVLLASFLMANRKDPSAQGLFACLNTHISLVALPATDQLQMISWERQSGASGALQGSCPQWLAIDCDSSGEGGH